MHWIETGFYLGIGVIAAMVAVYVLVIVAAVVAVKKAKVR